MKDRALVVAPLPACVGEGRDAVRGEGWNGVYSVHILTPNVKWKVVHGREDSAGLRLSLKASGYSCAP